MGFHADALTDFRFHPRGIVTATSSGQRHFSTEASMSSGSSDDRSGAEDDEDDEDGASLSGHAQRNRVVLWRTAEPSDPTD